jgi:two-component system sensor histidine kinase UhpB
VQKPSSSEDPLLRRIAELRRVAGDALRTVQQLAFELRPTVLDDLGLVPALRRLVGDMASRHDLAIHLETGDLGTGDRLPSEAETAAYRVVQEALTNVVRHSKASMCSVVLAHTRGNLRLVVEDDGVGFDDMEPAVQGLGLRGMSERAALAGGTVRITSRHGEGTTVVLEVPVD